MSNSNFWEDEIPECECIETPDGKPEIPCTQPASCTMDDDMLVCAIHAELIKKETGMGFINEVVYREE